MDPYKTDRDWEALASANPYWAVLTHPNYLGRELSPGAKDEFYESGRQIVEAIIDALSKRLNARRGGYSCALDFGCGVGRLLFALAEKSAMAIGVDISESMLRTARRNAQERGVGNIELVSGDDGLAAVEPWAGKVDLLTSMIVFQHIAPQRGCRILDRLLDILAKGGVGYLHFTIAEAVSNIAHEQGPTTGRLFRYYQRTAEGLLRIAEMEPPKEEMMQMNHYNVNELLAIFYAHGISDLFIRQYQQQTTLGVEIAFRKP